MGDKFVNQFMAEKAGMEGVNLGDIEKKVQQLSKGSRKDKHDRELGEKRQHELEQMRLKLHAYNSGPDKQTTQMIIHEQLQQAEKHRDLSRIWAHFDFDMFYVACELLDRPDLADKPCAVGSQEGVLCTANYVARKFGVRSAQPTFLAKSICPYLVLIPPNFEKYRKYSDIFRSILAQYDEDYESLGLDEAYVDLTDHLSGKSLSETHEFISNIRTRIYNDTKLTVSCGVGANKMLCKMASEQKKPNDQFVLPNERETILKFLHGKPIRKIPGVGPVNEYFLKGIGIATGGDLLEKMDLVSLCFSEHSTEGFMFNALGISRNIHEFKQRKSVGRSDTFRATDEEKFWVGMLEQLCQRVSQDLKQLELMSKTVTLSFQTHTFEKRDKSTTLDKYVSSKKDLLDVVLKLLNKQIKYGAKLRLLGVRCTNLASVNEINKQTLHAYLNKAVSGQQQQPKQHTFTNKEEPLGLQDRAAEPSSDRSQQSKSVQRDFECPVCGKTIECRGNYSKFQRHLNHCLQEPAASERVQPVIKEEDEKGMRLMRSPGSIGNPGSGQLTEHRQVQRNKKRTERTQNSQQHKPSSKQSNMLQFIGRK